jgi:arylsulfatase
MFGKWHIGDTEGRYPTDQGFDEWYGIPRSSDRAYWPDGGTFVKGIAPFTYVLSSERGEKPKELTVYNRAKRETIDREITDKAIDFIERKAKEKKPFFAYIPYTQTHDPTDPHPDFKGSTGYGNFADVLAQTDAYVGDLLATIDKLGLKKNTIFIFTSDNGPDYTINSIGSSGPWRDYMFTPYEGSLRVPFIVQWPGKIPAGQKSNDIVHQIDLFPTIAKWVGGDVPNDRVIDGVDQSDFFMGKTEKGARESMVIYVGNELFGAKWRNYKILFKGIGLQQEIIQYAYPAVYNLIKDPKEKDPFENFVLDTWIDYPLYEVVENFKESLEKDKGTPGN